MERRGHQILLEEGSTIRSTATVRLHLSAVEVLNILPLAEEAVGPVEQAFRLTAEEVLVDCRQTRRLHPFKLHFLVSTLPFLRLLLVLAMQFR